jgi:hypothetical protein
VHPHHSVFMFQNVALSLLCVMSLALCCRESTECFPGIVSRYYLDLCLQFQWPQWLLAWQSISYSTFAGLLYLHFYNFFSASFCITFLSDGIATYVNKWMLSVFSYYVWPIGYTPWSHSTVISSCSHTALDMCEN